MEPVDPRMGGLLGGADPGDPAGGPEDLRAIVARAGRRMRLRAGALAGAVAMVAGGGVGYAVSTIGGSSPQVVATSQGAGGKAESSAPGAAQVSGGAPSYAVLGVSKFTRLFTRQANGIDIRAFLVSYPMMTPLGVASGAAEPACGTVMRLQAELSTPGMVAVAGGGGFADQQSGHAIVSTEPEVVGQAEGDPVAVVVVLTDPTVAKVRMSFAGGVTDEMAPHEGWSVLAAPDSSFQSTKATTTTLGTLTALGSSGRALATRTLTWPPEVVTPIAGGSSGSVGSGSGTAGSGTVGSGTAVQGSAGNAPGQAAPPVASYPCQVPPPCGGYQNATVCPAPRPLPAVTTPNKTPSNSAATTAGGSGG